MKIFVDGNLEKRFEKLQAQLEFVADGFDRFDDLIADYIRARPSAAYDTGISDGERMLVWLTETKGLSQNPTDARNVRGDSNQRRGFRIDTKTLSPEQLDYIACQRARHAIEETARQHIEPQEKYAPPSRMIFPCTAKPSGDRIIEYH